MSLSRYLKSQWKKIYGKIVHEKASPEYIARGWAIGMFYGLFIPFGAQLICSVPTALLLKGSKIGAVFGTLVTNHFTIFLIYPVQCYFGNKCIGGNLSFESIRTAMAELIKHQNYQAVLQMSTELIISFFAGGAIMAVIATPLTYIWVKKLVVTYRAQIEKRRLAKQKRLAAKQK